MTRGPDTSMSTKEINPDIRDSSLRGIARMTFRNRDRGTTEKFDWREVEIDYTHHGPIVARKAQSYSRRYYAEVGLTDRLRM